MLITIACNYINIIEYVLLYGVRFIFSGKKKNISLSKTFSNYTVLTTKVDVQQIEI